MCILLADMYECVGYDYGNSVPIQTAIITQERILPCHRLQSSDLGTLRCGSLRVW